MIRLNEQGELSLRDRSSGGGGGDTGGGGAIARVEEKQKEGYHTSDRPDEQARWHLVGECASYRVRVPAARVSACVLPWESTRRRDKIYYHRQI